MEKIRTILMMITLFTLLLAGCAAKPPAASLDASPSQAANETTQELSGTLLLAAGILRLEGTDLAVQAHQAAELLPLWQAYLSLSSSETSAQVELDGLISQISEAITADQMKSIKGLGLTNADLAQYQSMPVAENDPSGSNSTSNQPGGAPPGGGEMMLGGDMNGMSADVSSPSVDQNTKMQSSGSLANQAVVQAVIDLLKTKI